MSSFAISTAIPPNVTQVAATARTGPAQATSSTIAAPDYTVKLSAGAQAEMMHQSGQSVASIASSMGTNVDTVDGYLGIVVAVAVPLSAAHNAPAAKAPLPAVPPAATANVPHVNVNV
jgi:hypothetical protein